MHQHETGAPHGPRHTPVARLPRLPRLAARAAVLSVMVGGCFAFGAAAPQAGEHLAPVDDPEAAVSRSHERTGLPVRTVVLSDSAQPGPVSLETTAGTVREVLLARGTVLDPHDVVAPALDTPVTDGLGIVVSRAVQDSQTATVLTAHTTRTVEDPTLPAGTTAITQEGADGTLVTIFTVVRTPAGTEIAREPVLTLTTAPVEEVVTVGTLAAPPVQAMTSHLPVAPGTNRALGMSLAAARGWRGEQFACLDSLWTQESQWDHTAQNRSSGAFGIPQSYPASKLASAGKDWRTNPATQIRWGLGYIDDRHGTPCTAWAHFQAKRWY